MNSPPGYHLMGLPCSSWQAGPRREEKEKSLCCFSCPPQGHHAPQGTQSSGQCQVLPREACPSAHNREPRQAGPPAGPPRSRAPEGPLKRLCYPSSLRQGEETSAPGPDSTPTNPTAGKNSWMQGKPPPPRPQPLHTVPEPDLRRRKRWSFGSRSVIFKLIPKLGHCGGGEGKGDLGQIQELTVPHISHVSYTCFTCITIHVL